MFKKVLIANRGEIAVRIIRACRELGMRTGEGLLIVEAMKMENEIRALRTGMVEAVQVIPGQRVRQDDVLLRLVQSPA